MNMIVLILLNSYKQICMSNVMNDLISFNLQFYIHLFFNVYWLIIVGCFMYLSPAFCNTNIYILFCLTTSIFLPFCVYFNFSFKFYTYNMDAIKDYIKLLDLLQIYFYYLVIFICFYLYILFIMQHIFNVTHFFKRCLVTLL